MPARTSLQTQAAEPAAAAAGRPSPGAGLRYRSGGLLEGGRLAERRQRQRPGVGRRRLCRWWRQLRRSDAGQLGRVRGVERRLDGTRTHQSQEQRVELRLRLWRFWSGTGPGSVRRDRAGTPTRRRTLVRTASTPTLRSPRPACSWRRATALPRRTWAAPTRPTPRRRTTPRPTRTPSSSQESSDSCFAGCGGSGQAQELVQDSFTGQEAYSEADADQNGVNANTPVSVAGVDVESGDSSADQTADNSASSTRRTTPRRTRTPSQSQSSSDSCFAGCGGSGQAQALGQFADTEQYADSSANADQNGVNTNAPVADGRRVRGGGRQLRHAVPEQLGRLVGVELRRDQPGRRPVPRRAAILLRRVRRFGPGAVARSRTPPRSRTAYSEADAYQNGVNANVPVTVAGVFADGGDVKLAQTLDNSADRGDERRRDEPGNDADPRQQRRVRRGLRRLGSGAGAHPGRLHRTVGRLRGGRRSERGELQHGPGHRRCPGPEPWHSRPKAAKKAKRARKARR